MNQQALQDNNQVDALIAHSGTAGTAETVRVVVSPSGNFYTEAPVPTASNNGSVNLYYNTSSELVRVNKYLGTTTYTKNIVPTSGDTTITGTKTISSWS